MAISSIGIGSGLPVESIISKLTDLEKAPLVSLKANAETIQAKVSAYSQVKSLISTLSDATAKLTRDSAWNGLTVATTNTSAVNATVTGIASASTISVGVQKLAQAQSTASAVVPTGTDLGGALTIQLGTWNAGATGFTPGLSAPVSITMAPGETSLAAVASRINDANAGVTATVLKDASGERLMIRSKDTGEAAGFQIKAGAGATAGLANLAYDPGTSVSTTTRPQAGQNAQATINGVSVSSATNTLTDTIPGLTIQLSQVTTSDTLITASTDTGTMKKNIQEFVDAYNAVSKYLGDSTKYDSETKSAGLLQGDGTALGLQNTMRAMLGSTTSGGVYSYLSDIGVSLQRGGGLQIDGTKLDKALKTPENVKKLFATDSGNLQSGGLAVKLKSYMTGLLSLDGTMNNKADALTAASKRNTVEQDKVNARASLVEKRLKAQYTALDTQMANLTALSAYVTQQVTTWNNTKS
jgi:flagellar hook-associated protein 2